MIMEKLGGVVLWDASLPGQKLLQKGDLMQFTCMDSGKMYIHNSITNGLTPG